MKKISVIIPCYNEEESIALVIDNFPKNDFFSKYGLELEVFVINNNSNDKTKEMSIRSGANVIFEPKKGKGNAIRAGFNKVPKDSSYIAIIDGDNTYSSNEIMNLLTPLLDNSADVVYGSRLTGNMAHGSMTKLNHFGNLFYTGLVRLIYNLQINDALTGFVVYKKEVIDNLQSVINAKGFGIEMEILTKLAKLNFKIKSVPISYSKRVGKTKLKPITDGISIMKVLLSNIGWHPPKSNS